jgi:hypothetical protein
MKYPKIGQYRIYAMEQQWAVESRSVRRAGDLFKAQ